MTPDKAKVVAIIPARGGSKGLPRKNVRPLAGKPLIAWTIEAAKGCAGIDRVVVTTDDEEIAAVARAHGAEVPFLRPADLARDDTTTEATLKHAVEALDRDGWRADVVVFLQPTDVFRRRAWLDEAVQTLLTRPEIESAFVVNETHKNYWRLDANGAPAKLSWHVYGPRQKREPILREDTGLACATRADLVRAGLRIGERVHLIRNKDFATSIDIHDDFDLWLAEKVIAEWGWKPNA